MKRKSLRIIIFFLFVFCGVDVLISWIIPDKLGGYGLLLRILIFLLIIAVIILRIKIREARRKYYGYSRKKL